MVRKLGTMSLLVAALMLVMMVAGASANLDEQTVDVNAFVNQYAEMNCPASLDLPAFTGFAYEQQSVSGNCTMKANTLVDVTMEISALRNFLGYEIGTAVRFARNWNNPLADFLEDLLGALRLIDGPWATGAGTGGGPGGGGYFGWTFSPSATRYLAQGVEEATYDIDVYGKLRDIHEQSAGNYSTEIVFTVAGFF